MQILNISTFHYCITDTVKKIIFMGRRSITIFFHDRKWIVNRCARFVNRLLLLRWITNEDVGENREQLSVGADFGNYGDRAAARGHKIVQLECQIEVT